MDFTKTIINYIEENRLLAKGDVCIVGLSGGADSVALLTVLCEYAKALGIDIVAAHVNHNLRESAKRDQEFARNLCKDLNVAFEVKSADVGAYAKERGLSLEEAGRDIRYAFFEELAKKYESTGANVKIAVAHHMCDLAETVIFNMVRGSGIRGLRGIANSQGRIVRPLLCVTKEDIKDFLTLNGIAWVEDETNKCEDYSRNKIRNSVIPDLTYVNSEAVAHIAQMADEAGEIESLLEDMTARCLEKYTRDDEGILILSDLLVERDILVNRVILDVLRKVSGKMKDIGRVQVRATADLFEGCVGSERNFIYGLKAVRTYDGVRVTLSQNDGNNNRKIPNLAYEVTFGECVTIDNMSVQTTIKADFDLKNIPAKRYTKWFDCDKIKNRLEIRHRRERDYLIVDSAGSRKSLSDYLKNEKVELAKRDEIWVVADGNHILWVIGRRIDEYYKVTNETKQIVEITVSEGE